MTRKLNIHICMGSSCFARGNAENLAFLEQYVKDNRLEADIDIAGGLCEGKCANGPHLRVNGTDYDAVTPEKIKQILQDCQK